MQTPLAYKRHYQALIRLGVPLMIGQLGTIVLGFADTIMIGHHSAAELSAAGLVNNLFNLSIIFCLGFSYGLTPIVGALFGRGEGALAGGQLKHGLLANLLIALLLCGVMGFIYFHLHRLNQPTELMPYIRPYYLILLVSLPFVMLFNAFKQFSDGITYTSISMWILIGGNVLNIVGNYLLIYGKFGFPELGLTGGGLSTLFSRIVMAVVFALIFFRSSRYTVYRQGFHQTRLNGADFRRLNRMGWPLALQMGMETASFSVCAIMLGWIGATALAAYQVMCTVATFCFMIYYGMGAAVAIRVSNYYGQQDFVNVRRSAYAGFHLIVGLEVILCSAIFLLRHYIGGWFTESQEVSLLVVQLVVPLLLYQFGDGLQITFANSLRGIADVKPMMYIALIAYLLISIPTSYVCGFVFDWGALGVWMGFPAGLTSAGVAFYYRFNRQTRKMLCQ